MDDELVEFGGRSKAAAAPREEPRPQPAPPPSRPAPAPAPEEEEETPGKTVMLQSPLFQEESEGPSARLTVSFGNDRGKEFPLAKSKYVVGRSLECSIVLNDASVSRKHFELNKAGESWYAKDLGSGNGTRIEGQKITELQLREGMKIEVGQTQLVFSSDEAKTCALEISPQDMTRMSSPRQPTGSHPVSPPNPRVTSQSKLEKVQVQAPPRVEMAADGPAEEKRSFPVLGLVLGIVGLAVVGVLVAQFALGMRILPLGPSEADKKAAAEAAAAAVKAEAVDLFGKGMKAFQAKDWDKALATFEKVGEKDKEFEGLDSAIERATNEKENAQLLASAKTASEKGKAEEALKTLAKVGDESTYYSEARQLMATVEDQQVSGEIDTIRGLLKARKKAEVKTAYGTLVEAHPENAKVAALADELVKAGIQVAAPTQKKAAAAEPAAPSGGSGATAKPAKGGKFDTGRAFQLYNAGSFDQAAAELRSLAERLKGDEAAQATDLAGKIDKFGSAYNEGKSSLAGKRLEAAEKGLTQALRYDQEVNGHYGSEIRTALGETYRSRAAAALQNADHVLAAKSAKRALTYAPSDTIAKEILDKCVAKAQSMFEGAQADVQAGRKDAARAKLRTVLDVVPSNHPLAEKASELMQQVR